MGARGPAPAPTALKLVKGERKDRVNTDEPVPAARPIAAPVWLSPDALSVWAEYAPDLTQQRVLTAWDLEAFAGWCDAIARRAAAATALDDEGEIIDSQVYDRNGNPTGTRRTRNPWALVWKDANEVIARVGARFGLTPSDRSQLKVGDGSSSGNPKERLLS